MITASEPLEFIPAGRKAVLSHYEQQQDANTDNLHSDTFLTNQLQNVVISDIENKKNINTENWTIRECTESFFKKDNKHDYDDLLDIADCSWEEELYFKGTTAVWSKGSLVNLNSENLNDSRNVIACYTCDSPIRHALFCKFYSSIENKILKNNVLNLETDKNEVDLYTPVGESISSICIIDALNIRVFTKTGEDFLTSLQFQVQNTWITRFGILLEKEQVPDLAISSSSKFHSNNSHGDGLSEITDSTKLPTLFSLSHPLDEMCPLIIKQSSGAYSYFDDKTVKIVYTCSDPSIVLVYDGKNGLHSVYRLRRTRNREYQDLCATLCQHSSMATVMSHLANNSSSAAYFGDSIKLPMGLLHSKHSSIGGTTVAGSSPFSSPGPYSSPLPCSPYSTPYGTPSNTGYNSSPFSSTSRNATGLGTTSSLARLSFQRAQSPLNSVSHAGLSGNSLLHSNISSLRDITMGSKITMEHPATQAQPLYPDLCLEHVWTESNAQTPKRTSTINTTVGEQATHCFLHTDLVGLTYLCYHQSGKMCLNIVRILNAHDPVKLIFSTATTIAAKDAAALPKMKMILVLDTSSNLILYSGNSSVGKIHVSGVLSSDFLPGLTPTLCSSFASGSPFPRRSSLLPSSQTLPEKHFEEFHAISPVAPIKYTRSGMRQMSTSNSFVIQGLRDAVGRHVSLRYPSEKYYRITLPPLTTCAFISKCLSVLRQILPRDLAMLLLIRWYGIRNSPGSQNMSVREEWELFQNLFLKLLGYDTANLLLTQDSSKTSDTKPEPKKPKTSYEPANGDWEYLISSKKHQDMSSIMTNVFGLKPVIFKINEQEDSTMMVQGVIINTEAPLFVNLPIILFSMHLLYEELKLHCLYNDHLKPLAKLLSQFAYDLRLLKYSEHYWKDFPDSCEMKMQFNDSQMTESCLRKLSFPSYMTDIPVAIFNQIYDILRLNKVSTFPYLSGVNKISKILVQIAHLLVHNPDKLQDLDIYINKIPTQGTKQDKNDAQSLKNILNSGKSIGENAVLFMNAMGLTHSQISDLPPSLSLMCHWAIDSCREYPPTDWNSEEYSLILRQDLITDFVKRETEIHCETSLSPQRNLISDAHNIQSANTEASDVEDGMEHIETQLLRLRFPKDLRINEIRRILHSATPVTIDITQSPEVTDHEFIEEQEKQLYSITTRTMALPIGRGMFTLRSTSACITEPLPIPKLCLTGKAPPRGVTVELTHIEVPPQMNVWPLFHNGAAAGLRLRHDDSNTAIESIDSTWIVYNRPKNPNSTSNSNNNNNNNNPDAASEHAGFLMALGLNGHLKTLSYMSVYEYLVKCNEMTSVGLLLGISATHRGTMDISTTKLLSIHLEALLPPTSIELDIPQTIQVAALLGVGLVYQGTGNRHMAEVLLSEIGRPPGPEMENSVERESYSLAAGLALGLVTLGHGGVASALTDLAIPDTLHYYMIGGNKRPLTGSQKEKYKQASFQIREGDCVNIDVTAPGATLALGLMFFATSNQTIADWMKPAETHYMLDFVRPDLLLLRTISRGLILWNEICPTENWIEDQVPVVFRKYCLCTPNPDYQVDVDYEGLNQAYCNILAGACFCIGLKYAGSNDQIAYELLLKYTQRFMRLGGRTIAELAGKSTIETCMNLILISLAMVMAGSGDLMTLRICRLLRARVGVAGTATATYGSHLATHMAAGLLLLGAGRYTLSTRPESVAAMVCAFFPKFPTHSNDNRYHLQAFRHLYVLAVEPRILIPRDIDSGLLCYSNVTVVYTESNETKKMKAPCFLPELHKLKRVQIEDERYWPVVFELNRNWDLLKKLLSNCYCLDIKQRAGCLPYEEDPEGFKTLVAQTLTTDVLNIWSVKSDNIFSFSSDPAVLNFTEQFLSYDKNKVSEFERDLIGKLAIQTYECVTRDMLHILPQRITLITLLQSFREKPIVFTVWQMKLLSSLVQVCSVRNSMNKLISHETVLSMTQFLNSIFDSWEPDISNLVLQYTKSEIPSNVPLDLIYKLISYLTFYEISNSLQNIDLSNLNPIEIIKQAIDKNINPSSVLKIMKSS